MRYIPIFFILLLTALNPVYAQQVSFIKYTVYDGLVSNPVRTIYQDSKGYIWIGTFDGLSRYDGHKFTNYTTANGLSHNLINSITEVNGKLLVAENNGAIDIFQNNNINKRVVAPSAINLISRINSRILVSSDENGFYEYLNDTLAEPAQQKTGTPLGDFIPLNDSYFLCTGVDDHLYVFTNDYTLIFSLYIPGQRFYSLFEDSKKRIWACTGQGLKLLKFTAGDKPSLSFESIPSEFNTHLLTKTQITSITEDADGSFWIGTQKGVVRIFPGGRSYVYNEKDGLPSSAVYTLYFDKEKNLWIGTSLGLAKWVSVNNVVFYNTDNKDFKSDIVTAFPVSKNKVLLKTNHGLQWFYVEKKEFEDIKGSNIQHFPVAGFSRPLVVYKNEIDIIDTLQNKILPFQKNDTSIIGVLYSTFHTNGTILLGTFAGVYAIEKKTVKKILPYRITGLSVNKDGSIWAGTWENGIFRILPKSNSGNGYEIETLTAVIGHKQIRSVFCDSKKNIWIGTRYDGAYCLTEKPDGKYLVQHFNRQSGLMSDWITSFAEKPDGDIWVGTYLGLDKLIASSSGYRIFNFSKAVNFFAEIKNISHLGNDNWLCVANTGVATFKDENLQNKTPLPPRIFSASLGIGENKLIIVEPGEKISLKPRQNALRFEFGTLGFYNERQILYTYRLKGSNDTTWSKPENIHEASYASLSPGHYSFEVKTLGWNGEFSTPASFSFSIGTPFWKQSWFIILCVALGVLIVYLIYQYQIRQLMRLQKIRNAIATDLHDEIGSSLTNISILAEMSRKKGENAVLSENLPSRIVEESCQAQQALDDIIWSVNSSNDNLNQTMARMRRYAAEVFEPAGINCKMDFENIPGDYKLNMEQRKDVYLTFKECLNNIIKHASAKNVYIKIFLEKNIFNLKIQDDGNGFDPLKQTDRNGLKNIRERVHRWNGKLAIHSATGKGTMVDCSFPLASPK